MRIQVFALYCGNPGGSFTPSDLTSPWMLVVSVLGCIFGLIGLGTVLVTWYLLVSDGWGPLVKAVLLGNRKGKRRFKHKEPGHSAGARQPASASMPASAMRQRESWR